MSGCGSSKHLPAAIKAQSFQPHAKGPTVAASPAKNGSASDSPDNANIAFAPTTRPATRPAIGASSGTFMYIGTVVAQVNGQPIYADKILTKVDTELSAKAPILEPREFKIAATTAIARQIEYETRIELEFAAAQRNTTDEEQRRATDLAAAWRQREIIKAGGSEAVARRISLDRDGIDFDERVKEQYQAFMILIWFQNRLEPRVQISGDDLRRVYDQSVSEFFTDKAGVRFRAIKIGVKERGSVERALKDSERILERLKSGEDFDKVAAEKNDDHTFNNWPMADVIDDDGIVIGKEPRFTEPGSWRLEQVEKAAFAMNVGEISPTPIDVGDGFYIIKLDGKRTGRVRPFEEPAVQLEIRRKIAAAQRAALREKEWARLRKQSVIHQDQGAVDKTVEMAMQKYYAWSRANGLTRADDSPVQRGTAR